MNLAMNIIIGNGISFVAGIFLLVSCIVNDEKTAYKYQFIEAFTLMISSVFFFSWTGVLTMGVAAARNLLVYKDRLTLRLTIFFLIFTVVFGFLINTLGIIGLLPVMAIVQITICNYCLKTIEHIKMSFIVNLLFYIVYFYAICDYISMIVQIITAAIGFVSWIKLIRK